MPLSEASSTRCEPPWLHICENAMVAPSAKPRFERRPVDGMPLRMESYCLNCGKFVASSESVKVLEIAEKAHVCRPVEDCVLPR